MEWPWIGIHVTHKKSCVESRNRQSVNLLAQQGLAWSSLFVVAALLHSEYAKARRIHLVLDNLNTHVRKCFDDVMGSRTAAKLIPHGLYQRQKVHC